MKTIDLRELVARVTASVRTTGGSALIHVVPPKLDLLTGSKPRYTEEIAAASCNSMEESRTRVDKCPNTERDEQGRDVGLGLTLRPTPHRLELEGRTLFAWCALDALLFPVLLRRAASIESPCRGTGEPVRAEVTHAGIVTVEPPSAVVSIVAARDLTSVRSVGCNNTHFISSPEAASRWLEKLPEVTILSVEEAFRLGRLIAEGLLGISRPDRSAGTKRERTGGGSER